MSVSTTLVSLFNVVLLITLRKDKFFKLYVHLLICIDEKADEFSSRMLIEAFFYSSESTWVERSLIWRQGVPMHIMHLILTPLTYALMNKHKGKHILIHIQRERERERERERKKTAESSDVFQKITFLTNNTLVFFLLINCVVCFFSCNIHN